MPTKVRLVKAMVFPVVMYGCESWTVKKAEHRRIDAFELWCLLTICGVLSVACQGFLVREACVRVLVGGARFLLSGGQ